MTSHRPVMSASLPTEFRLEGEIGRRLTAVTEQWILPTPAANPLLLSMFRDRDRQPFLRNEAFAGEFAGKYLTHSVQILKLTGDDQLRLHLVQFVNDLCACQAEDGYLGCWPKDSRLTNHAPNNDVCGDYGNGTWDTWSHYHVMLGLILWHELSGDIAAFTAATRIADLLCDMYLGDKKPRLVDTGCPEVNLAPVHSLALLYQKTGHARYLELARQIVVEFAAVGGDGKLLAGNYMNLALAGEEFSSFPQCRWENLHNILGLVELYFITGDQSYRTAFEHLWWSMLKGDRHNNGGFTSHEKAIGNPYHVGPIETCATVAWMAMSVDMLRLTGASIVADELELSMFNSGLGMMSPAGRWVTYNTPMDGTRRASPYDNAGYHARPGGTELNCCAVNGPRALGLLSEWALMHTHDGLALNYYGPGVITTTRASGNTVAITQSTDYPRSSAIEITLAATQRESFALLLRIPSWSETTRVWLNGAAVPGVKCGAYLKIERAWGTGDSVRIELDFALQFWRRPAAIDYVESHDWEAEWVLGGPVRSSGDTPEGLAPADLRLDRVATMDEVVQAAGGQPIRVTSIKGRPERNASVITFQAMFSTFRTVFSSYSRAAAGKLAAWCFTEVEAPSEGILPVMVGRWCDHYISCFVNGESVVKEAVGKKVHGHLMKIPLRKGRNLVAFRVMPGSEGWNITVAKGTFIPQGATPAAIPDIPFVSIYRGPVLLAYDARFNDGDFSERVPGLAKPQLDLLPKWEKVPADNPLILVEGKDMKGNAIRYCDFASAGATGNYYQSWVPVRFQCPEVEFTRENPRRSSIFDGVLKS